MKKLILSILVALVSATGFAQSCCAGDGCKKGCPFESFIQSFSDSTAYAMVNFGSPVLMISHSTFGEGDKLDAIAATLYGLDKAGKIVCYGEVRSQGTLYPIAVKDNTILVAGHHFVSKYEISGSPLDLQLIENASASYDTKGKATYHYENRKTEEIKAPKDSKKLDAMFEEVEAAKIVEFTTVKK